jgi:hypothetical protein
LTTLAVSGAQRTLRSEVDGKVMQVLQVAVYRFRATFRRRWGGYVTVVLLVGSIGGIAMAGVAAGRRTQSAFPTFLASTKPSDLFAQYSPSGNGYDAAVIDGVAHLPFVTHAESFTVLSAGVLNPELFFASNREMLVVAVRFRPVLAAIRTAFKDPSFLKNLETVGQQFSDHLEKAGPGTLEAFVARVGG